MPDTSTNPVTNIVTPSSISPEDAEKFKKMLECVFLNIGIEVGKQIREVFQAQIKMNQDNIKNLQAVIGIIDGASSSGNTPPPPSPDCTC